MKNLMLSFILASVSIIATSIETKAGETEAFLGGMVSGLVLGEVLDRGYPIYRPYANNYGNFNQQAIVDVYGYDDPTVYRPVCVRYWNGYGESAVRCSMQPVR